MLLKKKLVLEILHGIARGHDDGGLALKKTASYGLLHLVRGHLHAPRLGNEPVLWDNRGLRGLGAAPGKECGPLVVLVGYEGTQKTLLHENFLIESYR